MAIHIRELGHVVFYVSNLERSVAFYRDILGLPVVGQIDLGGSGAVGFSTGRTHHEMLLIEVGGSAIPRDHTAPGFYHVGFKIGDSSEELQAAYRDLKAAGVRVVGASDHHITHSLYVLDPDGNEVELYADVSDEWKTNPNLIFAPIRRLDLEG